MVVQELAENPKMAVSAFFDEAGGLSGFAFAVVMAVITGLAVRHFSK